MFDYVRARRCGACSRAAAAAAAAAAGAEAVEAVEAEAVEAKAKAEIWPVGAPRAGARGEIRRERVWSVVVGQAIWSCVVVLNLFLSWELCFN